MNGTTPACMVRDGAKAPPHHEGLRITPAVAVFLPLRTRDGDVAGAEIVGAEVGQLAFQAFDVQPQRLAMAEQEQRAAARGIGGVEFDPYQFQHRLPLLQIDVARLAGQNAVEAQGGDQAARFGARISLDGETATIDGTAKLRGAPVMATDLRASVSLVIAGLAAEGETMVNRVYHLDRGFERLEEKLSACGASIQRISD